MTLFDPMGRGSPFDLSDDEAYRRWRDRKLAEKPASAADILVEVGDPAALTDAEQEAILQKIQRCNMAVYAAPPQPELDVPGVRALGRRFGLESLDANMLSGEEGISTLTVAEGGTRAKYIPYTNRPISWHTDGYYNDLNAQVRGMILHCVEAAADGGENELMDPELMYILLREENPDHIAALMRDDAMIIPGNAEEGFEARSDSPGPVFMVMADGTLHMRFTDRKRNIVWSDAPEVQAAVAALKKNLDAGTPESEGCVLRHCLASGQGLICNNVLHNRRGFSDGTDGQGAQGTHERPGAAGKRKLFRARYHDRVAGT